MIFENIIGLLHKFKKFSAAVLSFGKILAYTLAENIVRTHEIVFVVAVLPDKTMAIAYTRVEFTHIVAKLFFKSLYKLISFLGRYFVCTVVDDYSILIILLFLGKSYNVTSVSRFIRLHFYTHPYRFKRGTSL